jgi:hypothetical protein
VRVNRYECAQHNTNVYVSSAARGECVDASPHAAARAPNLVVWAIVSAYTHYRRHTHVEQHDAHSISAAERRARAIQIIVRTQTISCALHTAPVSQSAS